MQFYFGNILDDIDQSYHGFESMLAQAVKSKMIVCSRTKKKRKQK